MCCERGWEGEGDGNGRRGFGKTYLAQSRGVPSITLKPGIVTPLAPWMEVRTQWEKACEARAATAMMVEVLKYIFGVVGMSVWIQLQAGIAMADDHSSRAVNGIAFDNKNLEMNNLRPAQRGQCKSKDFGWEAERAGKDS